MASKRMTLQEAADLLGVTPRTVGRWVKRGVLKGRKMGRSRQAHVVVSRRAVEALLSK